MLSQLEQNLNCKSLLLAFLLRSFDFLQYRAIQALESDIQAIRAEHETQNRMIQGQKIALDGIIADLGSLRLMGKDKDTTASVIPSPTATPAPENSLDMDGGDNEGSSNVVATIEPSNDTSETADKETEDEDRVLANDGQKSTKLNPRAAVFRPTTSSSSRAPSPSSKQAQEDDIEMGEVEEPKYSPSKGRRNRDELEEGEASDSSHALTEPPDD
jgi:THO complex subunit 7